MASKTIHLVFDGASISTGSSRRKLLEGMIVKALLIHFSQVKACRTFS